MRNCSVSFSLISFRIPHSALQKRMFDLRLLLVAVIWAVNFSVVKYALADFSPLSFTVVRFALAAGFLFLIMRGTGASFSLERRDRGPVIRLGFIGITLYNLLFMYGLKYTTASNSALFISLSPLFAALILALSEKTGIRFPAAAGLLLSTVGVYLIIRSNSDGISFSRHDILGDVLTLFAAVLWALYTIRARPLLKKYAPIKITAYSMAAGALMLLPIGASDLVSQPWRAISWKSWGAFCFSTFISAGVAFTWWYDGVKRIGVTRTVVYHYLVPFIAVLFAALFLRERITLFQVIGGAMILAGVYLVQKRGSEK
jgi:drug/metabolite transporter (DMT)-like permease